MMGITQGVVVDCTKSIHNIHNIIYNNKSIFNEPSQMLQTLSSQSWTRPQVMDSISPTQVPSKLRRQVQRKARDRETVPRMPCGDKVEAKAMVYNQ